MFQDGKADISMNDYTSLMEDSEIKVSFDMELMKLGKKEL